MRKAISLLLALVLCLPLCACGNSEEENEIPAAPVATLPPFIEGAAVAGSAELDETALEQLCGEWKVLMRYDVDKLESIIIHEDGTLLIGDRTLTWQYTPDNSSMITLSLFDGEEKTGTVEMVTQNNGDIVLYYYLGDERFESISLYNPSHYEKISINVENVYEYFELRDVWEESRNAFGELTHVKIATYLVLKEQYFSRMSERLMNDGSDQNVIENGAVEWFYERSGLDVVVNLEEKTYVFENFKTGSEDTGTSVSGFTDWGEYAGFSARRLQLVPDSEGRHTYTWACPYEMEILRVKLDLYLIAE